MNKKSISKFVALFLISTVVSTAFCTLSRVRNVQAIENVLVANENVIQEFLDIDNLLNLLKEKQNMADENDILNENEFEVKAEGYSAIINRETGNITHNFYDEAGILVNSYTTNYYENIKNIFGEYFEGSVVSDRSTIASNSIPYRLNSLHYTIAEYSNGHKIYAQNSRNNVKAYSLSGKYTSNSNVMDFIYAVDRTASKVRLFVNTAGVSAAIAIVGFFGLGGKITISALIASLNSLGYVSLVTGAAGITKLYNDYVEARIEADHKFNAL